MAPNAKEISYSSSESSTKIPETGNKTKEILYNGYFYDVTNFIRRHPGGKIIEMYTKQGEDATQVIQQFHQRAPKKVNAIMNSLKKRPAESHELGATPETISRHKLLTEDFQKLHDEFQAEGLFEPSPAHIAYRISEVVACAVLGWYLISLNASPFITAIGVVFIALFEGRGGYLYHEAGHRSLTANSKVDSWIEIVVAGLANGLAACSWSSQHNRHHAMTQRLHHDVDLETMPLMAFNAKAVKDPKKSGNGFFVQNQRWLFLAIDTLLATAMWKIYLHPKTVLKKRAYIQFVFMAAHYVLGYQIGFWNYLFAWWLASIYLLGNFSLSHTHFPVNDGPQHFVEYALCHTTDIEPSWWCDWWMGYLNYQIEHHLFPQMPQFRNYLIRDRVKAFAKKHDIPYRCMSYWEAVKVTSQNLAKVSEQLKS